MIESTKLLYVTVLTFDDEKAIVKDETGAKVSVRGPGVFEVVDGRFCCRASILMAEPPKYLIKFPSGEEVILRDERPRFYDGSHDRLAV